MIEEALHVILDPGHILAEVVLEVASYLTIGKLAIWLHDRKHHGKTMTDVVAHGHQDKHVCDNPEHEGWPWKHPIPPHENTCMVNACVWPRPHPPHESIDVLVYEWEEPDPFRDVPYAD